MLTKDVVVGLITILEDQRLQVRIDTVIREGDVEISRQYFRYMLNPGEPTAGREVAVQKLAAFLWTPEVIERWKILEKKMLEPMAAQPVGATPLTDRAPKLN